MSTNWLTKEDYEAGQEKQGEINNEVLQTLKELLKATKPKETDRDQKENLNRSLKEKFQGSSFKAYGNGS